MEIGKYGPSPDSYTINYHFPRRVTNKSFTLREIPFWSDQQKILINCILKYFDGSQLVKKATANNHSVNSDLDKRLRLGFSVTMAGCRMRLLLFKCRYRM